MIDSNSTCTIGDVEEIMVRGEPGSCGVWVKVLEDAEWLTSDLSEYGAPEDLSKALSAWSTAWFQGWRKEPDGAWYPCDSEGLDLARRVKQWAGPRVTVTHVSAAGQSTVAV